MKLLGYEGNFCAKQGLSGMDQYFAMARGAEGIQALDMSKFFDTNYHYMVSHGCNCCIMMCG